MPARSRLMLTSQRLHFETWTDEDHTLLMALHADPRVQTGYAPGADNWTHEAIERRLRGYMNEQETVSFTKWKLSLADGTFIGRAGWSPWENGSIEIGYAIRPEFWNMGYASEAAQALMDWALQKQTFDVLIGFALPDNLSSRRIIERIGMTFIGHRIFAGTNYVCYERRRQGP